MNEIRITAITIYPIKSTAGISVDECRVEAQGLRMDRRWLVVDADGNFLTGREFPLLTQVRSRLDDGGLSITAPGMDEMRVPFPAESATARSVKIWNDECRALSAGNTVDDWFANLLATRCHLVYMNDTSQRPVDFAYGRPGDRVSFADGYPLLLISEASLADLNTRTPEPASMGRFRPNIVVDGCAAYDEDGWRRLRMGDVQFDGVKNCVRCVFTTVDPDNGDKHPQLEPLRTLGSYRRRSEGGVFFGQNLIPRTLGTVRVGDLVEVNDEETQVGRRLG